MDFQECVKGRRSIRRFTDQKVEHEKFEEIVEVARYSPSWKNTQIVRYTLVEDENLIRKIAEECVLGFIYNTKTLADAKAVVVITMLEGKSGCGADGELCTDKGETWEMFDAGIAAQTFCLAAHEQGLGTVIMGIFEENKIKEVLDIPGEQKVAAVIPIGYPAQEAIMPKRLETEELISYI